MMDRSKDPNWSALLYLFSNHDKLQTCLTSEFVDLEEGIVHQKALLKKSKVWSRSEQFMLKLALYLYSGNGKLDLNDMDYLDDKNKHLVMEMEAMKIRFKAM
ncbi:hypothetical protein M4A92_03485 [Caldibacillus thermoamylovorans]|uniref:hypothetical protein n=1 Tax=Caldibacillus thermoamylovorans TaxID=35841 RepID=UPI00203BCA53|nr:hypothetical protein [Caldibacillus thermoamylovorans]MCM3797721.1 hypothetical protein [Caldibacillus thermoamylovorans]